jgi:hypothetical protein
VYLIPKDLLKDVPDSGSGDKFVQNIVPKVTEKSGCQAKAEAHVEGSGKIDAEKQD